MMKYATYNTYSRRFDYHVMSCSDKTANDYITDSYIGDWHSFFGNNKLVVRRIADKFHSEHKLFFINMFKED
jgi:hypothetical protein